MATDHSPNSLNVLEVIADLPSDDYGWAAILQEAATSGEMLNWQFPAYLDESYPPPDAGKLPSLGHWDDPPADESD